MKYPHFKSKSKQIFDINKKGRKLIQPFSEFKNKKKPAFQVCKYTIIYFPSNLFFTFLPYPKNQSDKYSGST